MAAENLILEAEFNPHVVIIANDLARYGEFAKFLTDNGFPTQVRSSAEDSVMFNVRPGTVYFVSFNLLKGDPVAIARDIEKQLGMTCIVFAESEDFKTAAKLSSAKMTQTLQYPYTQKNYLMAIHTIVKKRKAEYEKEMRKASHKARAKSKAEPESVKTDGVYMQRGLEAITGGTEVVKGVAATRADLEKITQEQNKHLVIQEGSGDGSFFAIIKNGETAQPRAKFVTGNAPASTREDQPEVTLDYSGTKEEPKPSTKKLVLTEAPAPSIETETPAPSAKREYRSYAHQIYQEKFMDERWGILGVLLTGIAFCLYCIYQILFSR